MTKPWEGAPEQMHLSWLQQALETAFSCDIPCQSFIWNILLLLLALH